MDEPAVVVDRLVMRYGDVLAADGLSLEVPAGSLTAVVGPNGAGKTTAVETCEGFRRPQRGVVRVLGLDPVRDHAALAPRVGVSLQSGGAWSGVRALEMLHYVSRLHAFALQPDLLVERLGLASCGATPYRRLSGGQQQRLGLAMALLGRPELVFLDEPTAGLDPAARHAIWALLGELRGDGVTVVFTTHYLEEAERLADLVNVVDKGRVIAAGTPAELTTRNAAHRVSFSARPGLELGSLLAALPAGFAAAESRPGAYRVEGDITPRVLAGVTQWCANNGVLPTGLAVERQTLEDVFLELTGKAPPS